ncbi:MAG: phosphate ABC transporter permease subunit PstC [Chloroflexi bacterium]|nr:phosphate ABC transporter permease subunit PstC [Chloroflexota bacterium]
MRDPIVPDPFRDAQQQSDPNADRPLHPGRPLVQGDELTQQGLAGSEGLQKLEEQAVASPEPRREPHPPAQTPNTGDRVFNWVTAGFAGLIIAILALIIVVLTWQSRLTITHFGLSFLYNSTWNTVTNEFGGEPSILGTVYTSLLALLLAAPVAVMAAIFLVELAPRSVRFSLGFIIELLAAVPSIVFGLWALLVLKPDLIGPYVEPWLISHFGGTPVLSGLFNGYPTALDIFTASIILSIMILPTIASISRDVMLAVPNIQRDAMLALGATRWETTWKAVVPYARSGIIGGIILGLGRAVGETMAVQMVIGNHQAVSPSLFQPSTTMAATIVSEFQEATADLHRSALIELALILMLVTVCLNAIARLLVWRVAR